MKLNDMDDRELAKLIEQLETRSEYSVDKYKRWEATQKLELARNEQRKRHETNGCIRQIRRLFRRR